MNEAFRAQVVHETARRIRIRCAAGADVDALRKRLEGTDGVLALRSAPAARSLAVRYDGQARTRRAILGAVARDQAGAVPGAQASARAAPSLVPLAAIAVPLLPAAARPYASLGAVGLRLYASLREGQEISAAALEAVSLGTTAVTGHPVTAALSILLSTVAGRWSRDLLEDTDVLLARFGAPLDGMYAARRGARSMSLAPDALRRGDVVKLSSGEIAPADGVLVEATQPAGRSRIGARIHAGESNALGTIGVLVERPADRSRGARMLAHVRHALRARDEGGEYAGRMERLLALPLTSAGLVLALTRDPGRSALMLQADPRRAIALAQPVARDAALYVVASAGALLSGMEPLERLAMATTFAFEDIGVLTEPYWRIERIEARGGAAARERAAQALLRLAGLEALALEQATFADELVNAWLAHGGLLRDGTRVLHVCGEAVAQAAWGIALEAPERRSLERRVSVIVDGRLLAVVHLRSALRAGLAQRFAQLRALGVRRIAIFTEDPTDEPATELRELGADEIVCRRRREQGRWLAEAALAGERVALVHTALRDLVPPGGLSLCPVDAEAGAHGVLLGDPLASLLDARAVARTIRARLMRRYGASVIVETALMIGGAQRVLPPVMVAILHHALAFALLADSRRLVRLAAPADRPLPHRRHHRRPP